MQNYRIANLNSLKFIKNISENFSANYTRLLLTLLNNICEYVCFSAIEMTFQFNTLSAKQKLNSAKCATSWGWRPNNFSLLCLGAKSPAWSLVRKPLPAFKPLWANTTYFIKRLPKIFIWYFRAKLQGLVVKCAYKYSSLDVSTYTFESIG